MSEATGDVTRAAEELSDAGLVTERQALAYVLRDVEAVPREEAAESMGISPSTLDTLLAKARRKVSAARATADAVDSIRFEAFPTHCSECGGQLPGQWVTGEDGEERCLDCAGIDESDASIERIADAVADRTDG